MHVVQYAGGEVVHQGALIPREDAPGQDHREAGLIRQKQRVLDGVGHHREPLKPGGQCLGQHLAGAAVVQRHHLALLHHGRGPPGDALLFLHVQGVPGGKRHIAHHGRGGLRLLQGHRAAVDAPQFALPVQLLQVLAHRLGGNAQRLHQLGGVHRAVPFQHL